MTSTDTAKGLKVKIMPLIGGDRATISTADGTRVLGVIVRTTLGGVWCIEGDPTQYGYRSKVAAAAAVVEKAMKAAE